MKTIDNPLDVDLKRLFNKARRKLKFPRKDSLEAKYSWSENLIRKEIGKQNETNMIGSSDQDDFTIDNKSTRINKPDESVRSESSPTDNDDDEDDGGVGRVGGGLGRDKYHDSFEVKKVKESKRNGTGKSGNHSQSKEDYKVQKKYKIRQNNFQKISEDKYMETIRKNSDYKQKMRSKYTTVLKPPRKTVKIKNPERIDQKINKLNENVYNKDEGEREAPFELLKPTSKLESVVVGWNSNRNSDARKTTTTPQKMKLRRRKKKKAVRPEPEQDTEPEKIIVLQKDFQEKVKKPLKTEWNAIFQGTYPRKKYLESRTTTTTTRSTQFYSKSVRGEKSTREPEHSMLRRLVEKYCQFENSLGIMRLCESQQLSSTRKHLEDPLSEVSLMTRPHLKTEANTETNFIRRKQEKEGSFVENVKSAFKNMFSYF